MKSFVYNRIFSIPFLRGAFPFYRMKSFIDPVRISLGKKLIWRNNYTSTMKITAAYMDRPVELGNFLFLRTREKEFMRNRIAKKAESVKYNNFYTTGSDQKYLKLIESDLYQGFDHLKLLLSVMSTTKGVDFPVSFASNVLYSLEKNGLRNEEIYQKVIFPMLKKKASYLHAEGLAGAIWALGQYKSGDSELIIKLLENYQDRVFGTDLVFVKNAKYSSESYLSADGSHGFESDSTEQFKKLYFNDHIACLELYEGLKNISAQTLNSKATSRVSEVLSYLEKKQAITSDSYAYYKQITEAPSTPVSTS